ncbi:NDR1/HIN1-like protein 3 [Rosa rugosa]|uniref:NDR1/HIN1-like protein 3 n=1 Tax=Rosa rugosa TaxID=74645 RepID=UPI002B40CB38|nr:NDR1/HIN1-like protein 3 [Rosa rugosa]
MAQVTPLGAGLTPGDNPHIIRPTKRPTILVPLCSLVFLIGFVSFLVLVIYFMITRDPTLPKFKVESATVTQLNIEGSKLTATWDFTLLATNPSRKLEPYYSRVQAGVRYQDGYRDVYTLVKKPFPSFVLSRRNQTRVGLRLGVWRQPGRQVAQGISGERKSELVSFGVKLLAKVWFEYSRILPAERGWLLVSCDRVDFDFSGKNGTGEMTSRSGQCDIDYYPILPLGSTISKDELANAI